ncbi:Hypothetical protein FKW44_018262 [Caligus rogercresseyi]|uniref:Uncharacterized protein n=1 Tax=Caligus rogercresseyi TaxID=217165 RepID=A0A7T8GU58_CALRO|nr:Hypothetical protein FKW44_018262 [Caligus rogercresseyi]
MSDPINTRNILISSTKHRLLSWGTDFIGYTPYFYHGSDKNDDRLQHPFGQGGTT